MRHKTIEVDVGGVKIGGDNPIRVQSMTNTLTADVDSTVAQILELERAGSELVRFTVKDDADAAAVGEIKKKLVEAGSCVPIIGDFHYNGHLLLTKYPECAKALDKYRINPGNVGFGERHDENFKMMIEVALKYDKPVRIGVNWGSLDQSVLMRLMDENAKKNEEEQKSSEEVLMDAIVTSAIESAKMAESYGLATNKIIISTKVSEVPSLLNVYRQLAEKTDYCLHLGLTEAGLGTKGVVASTAGLSVLLNEGIGDTIRVSITPPPGGARTEEVYVCQQVLQANGLRKFIPTVTSCPGCGRTTSTVFQDIAEKITAFLRERTPEWKKAGYKGYEEMTVAVMGCIVNGPGESKGANIGLSLPGTGEDPISPVYVDGEMVGKLQGEDRISDFKKMIEEYVEKNYS